MSMTEEVNEQETTPQDPPGLPVFSPLQDVGLTNEDHYLRFKARVLEERLKPLMQNRPSGGDIISRSICLSVDAEKGSTAFYVTDNVSYARIDTPSLSHSFPEVVVTDVKSLYEITKSSDEDAVLVEREGKLYARMFGGELFLPLYRLDTDSFKKELEDTKVLTHTKLADPECYEEALKTLNQVLLSSDIAELLYFFFEEGSAYASNGSVVSQYRGNFSDMAAMAVRHRDYAVLKTLLRLALRNKQEVIFISTDLSVSIGTEDFYYSYPKADVELSDDYKNKLRVSPEVYYIMSPIALLDVLSVLERIPGSSGDVELSLKDQIEVKTKSRKGDVSCFQVVATKKGISDEVTVSVPIKTMLITLRLFKGDSLIVLGIKDGSIHIGTEHKRASVLLEV